MSVIIGPIKDMIVGVGQINEATPITNLPDDTIRVRTRFRHGKFAVAFVNRANSIEQWYLAKTEGGMALTMLKAVNGRAMEGRGA